MKKAKKISETIYYYTAVFELNENGGYTVTVPALPGLVTEGRNFEEAKEMAKDAITCYLEGLIKDGVKISPEKEIAQVKLAVQI